jgi:hypothetical protein
MMCSLYKAETDTTISGDKMPQPYKLYLLNAPIVPIRVGTKCTMIVERTKDIEYVKKKINVFKKFGFEVVSAIGHKSTAEILSRILGFEVSAQRIGVELDRGDAAIAFALDFRLPEGKVLTEEELMKIIEEQRYSFYIIHVETCYETEILLNVIG